ncbi:MAG: glycosyltransferase family 4 protein [Sulfuricaulis sp.]
MERLKILFVTKSVPYPLMAGSSQRTANLIDALTRVGDVSLFVIGPPNRKPFLERAGYQVVATAEPTAHRLSWVGRLLWRLLPNRGENAWRALAGARADFTPDPGLSEALVQVLAREHFDLIVGRYLMPSAQAGILGQGQAPCPPVIIDIDDVDSKAVAAKIRSPASSLLLRAILKSRLEEVKQYEKVLLGRAARLWFSNPDDRSIAPGMNADVIPNIPYEMPDREDLKHSLPDSKVILWVGSFSHRVNLEGVDLFLQQVWEKILRANPGVRFRIVGSHLPDSVRRRWETVPGVDVVGFAESLREHYADAAFSIVPLMDGAGTKIKVLESLAYLRTCVVTTHSIAGFETLLRDRDSIRAVAGLDELASAVPELLYHPQTRHTMEDRGRAIIEEHFTRDAVRNDVHRSLQFLLGKVTHD